MCYSQFWHQFLPFQPDRICIILIRVDLRSFEVLSSLKYCSTSVFVLQKLHHCQSGSVPPHLQFLHKDFFQLLLSREEKVLIQKLYEGNTFIQKAWVCPAQVSAVLCKPASHKSWMLRWVYRPKSFMPDIQAGHIEWSMPRKFMTAWLRILLIVIWLRGHIQSISQACERGCGEPALTGQDFARRAWLRNFDIINQADLCLLLLNEVLNIWGALQKSQM